ncbi:hypothetical protein EHQ75_14815 [Leptospira levettii]|uniref:LIC_11090 family protein n=1 Tax=Leptospira levettii TaxID=2023178 RepID=UPI001082CE52|nr:hypothetical protein [Leptospira levettii]TGM36410.1 hypothetical protein EHQ75_14815 [Leptospira levettii]
MRKCWITIITILVLVPFLGKILFLESGLFAQSLYQLSMVCHCNHNSESEVHHDSESTPKKRMTCHLKKSSGTHTCTCSKKKMATKIIQSQSMNPSYVNFIKIQNRILFDLFSITSSISLILTLGYDHLPDKPPRLLT